MSRGNDLDEGIQGMIAAVTGYDCHLIKVPPSPNLPYTVLYPQPAPRGEGSWANPEEDRDYPYQVTCVGLDAKQVRWVQDKVEQGFLGRGSRGDYDNEIDAGEGIAVQWRLSDQLGAIVQSGDELFKADDTYRVRIGND